MVPERLDHSVSPISTISSAAGRFQARHGTGEPKQKARLTYSKGVRPMRRLLNRLLAGILVWSFAAVLWNGDIHAKEIGVIWVGKSLMTNNLVMGFLPRMRELAPDYKVTLFRELKNLDDAGKIFKECEGKMDGIVFLRSSGAEFLSMNKPTVPCFVGACNNPADLGAVSSLESPDGNVTGVTYFIPYPKRFDMIKSLFPTAKSLLLLLEIGQSGGPIDQAGTSDECMKRGIAYKEALASNVEDLVKKTQAAGKVDLIVLSNTRLVRDNAVNLLPIANATKTPMFSYSAGPVKAGALAGISTDDFKLGQMLADSVVDVVVKRKPVALLRIGSGNFKPKSFIAASLIMTRGLGSIFTGT